MFLIAGLGNPGKKYEHTKHNMGFEAVDRFCAGQAIAFSGLSMKAVWGKGIAEGQKVTVIKPMTYMNLSGEAVGAYVQYFKPDPANELIVVYDDLHLETGSIRIRAQGSAGGHNGMKSIIGQLGTEQFIRVRIGIGPLPPGQDQVNYVLAPFRKEEREKADEALAQAAEAIAMILREGAEAAMNRYNHKEKQI